LWPVLQEWASGVDEPTHCFSVLFLRRFAGKVSVHILHSAFKNKQFVPQIVKFGPRDDELGLVQPMCLRPCTRLEIPLTARALTKLPWTTGSDLLRYFSPAPTASG
jgi:hypothetical protein